MPNPFTFGSPVSPDALHGRRRELRRLVGRILGQGQSSVLVGEPRTGKTSLLDYLMSPDTCAGLYGEAGSGLLFRYFDAQMLGAQFCPHQFWEWALEPVRALPEVAAKDSSLTGALATCRLEGYGNFVLERLFTRLWDAGFTLVLLLDEFDALVEHAAFRQAEFYGGLRALASRYPSLALVIASRQSLGALNHRTQEFSRNGSPFFNIMEEIFIGPLTEKDYTGLLACAGERFSARDRRFLLSVAGGHPYLLQVAAAALWDAYEDSETDASQERWKNTGEALYNQAALTLADTWRLWSPEMKKAFTIVALDELPGLLGAKQFDLAALLKELPNYHPELYELKRRGFIREDESALGGWSVTADVMLWWLADEWARSLRQQDDLSIWLNSQGWEGLLKSGERKQISAAAKSLGGFLKDGLSTFIKAAAEGLGKSAAGVK